MLDGESEKYVLKKVVFFTLMPSLIFRNAQQIQI